MSSQRRIALSLVAAAGLALAGIAPFTGDSPEARADLPSGKPFFSESAQVDNPLFPIVPGSVKVWLGREGRRRIEPLHEARAHASVEEGRSPQGQDAEPPRGPLATSRARLRMRF